jgi:hypothetical protein
VCRAVLPLLDFRLAPGLLLGLELGGHGGVPRLRSSAVTGSRWPWSRAHIRISVVRAASGAQVLLGPPQQGI